MRTVTKSSADSSAVSASYYFIEATYVVNWFTGIFALCFASAWTGANKNHETKSYNDHEARVSKVSLFQQDWHAVYRLERQRCRMLKVTICLTIIEISGRWRRLADVRFFTMMSTVSADLD